MKKIITLSCITVLMLTRTITSLAGQWQQDTKGWRYQESNTDYCMSTWQWIDGNKDGIAECYYFDQDGYLCMNTSIENSIVNDAGAWVDTQGMVQTIPSSEIVSKNEFLNATAKSAYVRDTWVLDGTLWKYKTRNGFLTSTWKNIDGKTYYFGDDSGIKIGHQYIGGKHYYFDNYGILETKTFLENDTYYVIEGDNGIIVNEVKKSDWLDYSRGDEIRSVEEDGTDIIYETEEGGSTLTEKQAYDKILLLKSSYPEGKKWTNDNSYKNGLGCAAFAFIVQDKVFGNCRSIIYDDLEWNRLRVGDHIRLYNNTGDEHSVVILKLEDNGIKVAEGNYNSSIHWGRVISIDILEENFIYQESKY